MAAECNRRAIPLTILHPFSFAYYRAFGFERVADHRVLEFPITALNFVPRYPDLIRCTGDTHNTELAQVYNTFAADGRHLMFTRTPNHFPTGDNRKKVYLSRDGEGRPDGYIILEIENYFSVNRMVSVNLHIHELIALTDEAMTKLFGFIRFDRFFPAVVALALNSGAYLSEIIRSGIQSIDGGQTEAARSLGMTPTQTMRYIVLPQAIKNILPAIANEFVTIIKESSICWTIGVQEIMSAVNSIKAATYTVGEAAIIAACVYFCLTFPTSKIIEHFERKMSRGDKR